jgi:hypothetical protein
VVWGGLGGYPLPLSALFSAYFLPGKEAELFTWAVNPAGAPLDRHRVIPADQAARCVRRMPGRKWEALDDELRALGLYPRAWALPLDKQQVDRVQVDRVQSDPAQRGAAADPVAAALAALHIAVPTGVPRLALPAGAAPFAAVAAAATAAAAPPAKRRRHGGGVPVDMSDYGEVELWHLALKVVQEALKKGGTSPAEQLGDLLATRDMVRGRPPHLCLCVRRARRVALA